MGRITAAKTVTQRLVFLRGEEEKNRELRAQLREEKGTVIVFTRTKDGATRVFRMLHSASFYDVTYIHSDRLQAHREQALAEFRSGKYRILIATDVAGRGIHVDEVAHVINFDLPLEPEDYIHRVGRTGRAESSGTATSFATHRDRDLLSAIEKLIKGPIPEIPALTGDRPQMNERPQGSSSGGRHSRGPRGQNSSGAPSESAAGPESTGTSEATGSAVTNGAPIKKPAPIVLKRNPGAPAPGTGVGAPAPASGPVRPSQRPGPIRAIDLLPPAEFYEGEADLDWATGESSRSNESNSSQEDDLSDEAVDAQSEPRSGGNGHRNGDSRSAKDRPRGRNRRRRGGGKRGPRPGGPAGQGPSHPTGGGGDSQS